MNRIDLDREREKLEEQLADIQTKLDELNTSSEDIQLAEGLHDIQCHMSHEDMCDWEYGDWKDPVLRSSRKSYLEKAQKIFSQLEAGWGHGLGLTLSVDEILNFARLIR